MRTALGLGLAAAVLLAAPASRGQATVLSDNLSQPQADFELITSEVSIGCAFKTDLAIYELTSVTLPLDLASGPASDVVLELYKSAGGPFDPPDTLVGTLETPATLPSSLTLVTFPASGMVLDPGTTYWVVLRSTAAGTHIIWTYTFSDFGFGEGFIHTWGSSNSGNPWFVSISQPMKMRVEAEKQDPWTELGFGLPGSNGVLHLTGAGSLVAGSFGALKLVGLQNLTPGLLFVSTSNAPTPFKGGQLVPVPAVIALPVTLGFGGGTFLSWSEWPAGLAGTSIYFQCAFKDAGAVQGVALSTALQGAVP